MQRRRHLSLKKKITVRSGGAAADTGGIRGDETREGLIVYYGTRVVGTRGSPSTGFVRVSEVPDDSDPPPRSSMVWWAVIMSWLLAQKDSALLHHHAIAVYSGSAACLKFQDWAARSCRDFQYAPFPPHIALNDTPCPSSIVNLILISGGFFSHISSLSC